MPKASCHVLSCPDRVMRWHPTDGDRRQRSPRLPTEEQYFTHSKQSLPVDSLDERQDSTYNDNAFTWPVPTGYEPGLRSGVVRA
jgi:hypothetical protein